MLASGGCRPTPAPPSPHRVEYRLTWTADDVAPAAEGSWSVTSDLGYQVRVVRGWITSYSMELVECPKDADAVDRRRHAGGLFAGVAWAGHSAGTPNPAAIRPMQVESLTAPENHDAGAVALTPQAYCTLHYLVARAGKDAPGLPTTIDMVDASLHLEGTWRAPGAVTDTPFTLHTAIAYGQLFTHVTGTTAALHVDTGRESVRVEVRRRRAHMFDRVDFARMAERQVALQILTSFVDDAAVAITALDDAQR